MNEDVFNAVVARNAARAMGLPELSAPGPSVAATTSTTPLELRALRGTSSAALNVGAIVVGSLSWRKLATLHSLPTVFLVGGLDAAVPDHSYSRVQQYVERSSGEPAGGVYHGESMGSYYSYPDLCLFADSENALAEVVSAFATENIARLVKGARRHAPVAFNTVEFVEERDTRAQRLFAELQNGVAHGRATVERLRQLEDLASDEGEPFSLDALEGLVLFANAHPSLPVPELTLSAGGGIVAEWRRQNLSVTLHVASPINVQYLVKRRNPWYRRLPERTSGATTVDRVGEALKAFLFSEWPIRA